MWSRNRHHSFSLAGVTSHIINPKSATEGSKCHNFVINGLKTLALVLVYYVFSIGLTFYNRWLFKDFHYPLITTCTHFLTAFVLCGISRAIGSKCRKETPTLGWDVYLKRVFITGFASALDIGLSNWSFVFITVSFGPPVIYMFKKRERYTMVKSSAVVFILFFAILFGLEKLRWSLIIVVILIATGLLLFVYESTQFNLQGFILVLIAAFVGGLRWTFSQMLTQKEELGLGNPIDLMWHLQPTMFLGLFPLALGLEGLSFFTTEQLFATTDLTDNFLLIMKIGMGGVVAFFLGFSEYLLLRNTSSLTLSICGIFKELCTLLLAIQYNGDEFTLMNWIGFVICVLGIGVHIGLKNQGSSTDESRTEESVRMNLLSASDLTYVGDDSESEDEIFDITKS